jgi:hypothetical protein
MVRLSRILKGFHTGMGLRNFAGVGFFLFRDRVKAFYTYLSFPFDPVDTSGNCELGTNWD